MVAAFVVRQTRQGRPRARAARRGAAAALRRGAVGALPARHAAARLRLGGRLRPARPLHAPLPRLHQRLRAQRMLHPCPWVFCVTNHAISHVEHHNIMSEKPTQCYRHLTHLPCRLQDNRSACDVQCTLSRNTPLSVLICCRLAAGPCSFAAGFVVSLLGLQLQRASSGKPCASAGSPPGTLHVNPQCRLPCRVAVAPHTLRRCGWTWG